MVFSFLLFQLWRWEHFWESFTSISSGQFSHAVVSNALRSHGRQPTRLLCLWDSPGKNTGVSCHCLLQCMKVKSESEVTQSYPTLHDPMDRSPPRSSICGIFQARLLEWGAIAFSSVVSGPLQFHGLYPARLLCPWNSLGQNTGVSSCSPLQGIFPTQGSKPDLPHCRWILYHLSHQGTIS